MLESLFERAEEEEPEYIEKKQAEIGTSKTNTEKLLDYYSNEYEKSREELYDVKNKLSYLLSELSCVKNIFGKNYYRLNVSKDKIEDINI